MDGASFHSSTCCGRGGSVLVLWALLFLSCSPELGANPLSVFGGAWGRPSSTSPALLSAEEPRKLEPGMSLVRTNSALILELSEDTSRSTDREAMMLTTCNTMIDGVCTSELHLTHVRPLEGIPQGENTSLRTPYFGLFGVFTLPYGHYVALISKVKQALPELSEDLLEIQEVELVKIPSGNGTEEMSSFPDRTKQKEILRLLKQAFSSHSFYFSNGKYDVTRTVQWNILHGQNSSARHVDWTLSDPRFFWNFNLLEPFIRANAHAFISPIANAFIKSTTLDLTDLATQKETSLASDVKPYLILLSRRSCKRQGPRYIKRGIDEDGDVANFVETEQILLSSGRVWAHTQIRGSVPLFWNQLERFAPKPKIILQNDQKEKNFAAFRKHIHQLVTCYGLPFDKRNASGAAGGGVTVLNLIDKKGDQEALGMRLRSFVRQMDEKSNSSESMEIERDALSSSSGLEQDETDEIDREAIASYYEMEDVATQKSEDTAVEAYRLTPTVDECVNPPLKHVWFDFHKHCKNMAWKNLARIYPLITADLAMSINREGDAPLGPYFSMDHAGTILSLQSGVVRTNCIDCLDRTNVVQSVVARWVLLKQLNATGIVNDNSTVKLTPPLALPVKIAEKSFRKLWADHGDAISLLYAGSLALKRDFTRYGKRTRSGVLQDGINTALRYYVNNFRDVERQEGLELLLGMGTPWVSLPREDSVARPVLGLHKYTAMFQVLLSCALLITVVLHVMRNVPPRTVLGL